MFTSSGQLKLEYVRHGDMHKNRRARDRAAILLFCSLVNPKDLAYHPRFLLESMPEENELKILSASRRTQVHELVKEAYKKALAQHVATGSTHMTPNQIVMQDLGKYSYSLSWSSVALEMQYTLIIHRNAVVLTLIGQYKAMVRRCALNCGLPEPRKKSRDPWFRQQQRPEGTLPSQKDVELVNMLGVWVPLGELLDFLKKYDSK